MSPRDAARTRDRQGASAFVDGVPIAPIGRWAVDQVQSSVTFAVRHTVATLRGRFTDFEGTLDVGKDGVTHAAGSVKAASIDTDEPVRDWHLRDSADFFDVKRYPAISFSSTHVEHLENGPPHILGELTMRGVTRQLVLAVQSHGEGRDPGGKRAIALKLHGELSRKQFGLTWNQVVEAGGLLVGDRVKIALAILAVQIDAE
jgi:polyisoprenoid-binding protein YceI